MIEYSATPSSSYKRNIRLFLSALIVLALIVPMSIPATQAQGTTTIGGTPAPTQSATQKPTQSATQSATVVPTAAATQNPPPITATTIININYTAVIIDGPVQRVEVEKDQTVAVVVYAMRVKLRDDDPIKLKVKVGDWIRVKCKFDKKGADNVFVMVAITVIVITEVAPVLIVIGKKGSLTIVSGGNPNDTSGSLAGVITSGSGGSSGPSVNITIQGGKGNDDDDDGSRGKKRGHAYGRGGHD